MEITPEQIKQCRMEMGLSQKRFGEMLGETSHHTVLSWELGRRKPVGTARVLIWVLYDIARYVHAGNPNPLTFPLLKPKEDNARSRTN